MKRPRRDRTGFQRNGVSDLNRPRAQVRYTMTTPAPTIQKVEHILDAALGASPIFEGRETYVPLTLLREVVRELNERDTLISALREIAKGEAPIQPHGHYLAHREAVKLAREALQQ